MSAAKAWGYRHPHFVTGVRVAAGTWNLILATILISNGYPWGVALYAVSALIFAGAYFWARANSASRRSRQS